MSDDRCSLCGYDGPEISYSNECVNIDACRRRLATTVNDLTIENKRLRTQAEVLGDQICQFHDANPLNTEVVRLEKETEERRQAAWYWRDIALRIFRLWNPAGAEYDHWVKHEPELGHDHWHLCIYSKQIGPVSECGICQGRSGYDLAPQPENTVEALEAENRVVRDLVEEALNHLWVLSKEDYQVLHGRCTWMMGEEHRQPIDAEDVLHRLGIRVEVGNIANGVWEVRVGGHRIGIASFESTAIEDAKILSETVARSVRQATDPLLARIAALTREYQDYMTIANHCTAVYSHFSGGRISKPFTLPSEVIAQAEAIQQEDFEEWHRERLEVELDDLQALIEEGRDLMGNGGDAAFIWWTRVQKELAAKLKETP